MGNENQKEDKILEETESAVGFSKEELNDNWAHFQKAYPDGKLTRLEFVKENITLRGGREDVWNSVFDMIDDDKNGYVDFKEFMIFLSTLDETKSATEILNNTFDLVDLDGNGEIDAEELGWFVKVIAKQRQMKWKDNYGENFKEENVGEYSKSLFKKLDENGDGVVSREEFINLCQQDTEIREILTAPLNQMEVLKTGKDFEKSGIKAFEDQVGGHGSTQMSEIKKTILFKGDKILKPLDQREFDFFEEANGKNVECLKYMPKYYGRDFVDYDEGKERVHYIVMENLTYGMKKPCIIDAKMGTRGYGSDAKMKKVIQQKVLENFTLSGQIGFRLCGLKSYRKNMDDFFKLNKHKAGRIGIGKIVDTFESFFSDGVGIRRNLASKAVDKLKEIEGFFQDQKNYNFYSSSLLFIYDGDDENSDVKVAMVDFAHVDRVDKVDKGYLFGLKCLVAILDTIADPEKEKLKGKWYNKLKKKK